jgi:hypothetical protein
MDLGVHASRLCTAEINVKALNKNIDPIYTWRQVETSYGQNQTLLLCPLI